MTTSLLPLEIYEIANRATVFKVIAFVINVAVVVYLLRAKRLFGLRGGSPPSTPKTSSTRAGMRCDAAHGAALAARLGVARLPVPPSCPAARRNRGEQLSRAAPAPPPTQSEQQAVQAIVLGQLAVKGDRQQAPSRAATG